MFNVYLINWFIRNALDIDCQSTWLEYWSITCCRDRGFRDLSCFSQANTGIYYFILLFLVGWDWFSWYCGHYWPMVPAPDDRWRWLWRNWWNQDCHERPKYSEKTCPSATLSTTNPTWLDPVLNPGLRGGKPGTNRLSYGAALIGI
jgi:hypothetical protein